MYEYAFVFVDKFLGGTRINIRIRSSVFENGPQFGIHGVYDATKLVSKWLDGGGIRCGVNYDTKVVIGVHNRCDEKQLLSLEYNEYPIFKEGKLSL